MAAAQYKPLNVPYYYSMRRFFHSLLVAGIAAAPFTLHAQSGGVPAPSAIPANATPLASTPAPSPIPASSKSEDRKDDYSQEAFVIEQYRSLYRSENDGTGPKETIARISVQSEAR